MPRRVHPDRPGRRWSSVKHLQQDGENQNHLEATLPNIFPSTGATNTISRWASRAISEAEKTKVLVESRQVVVAPNMKI